MYPHSSYFICATPRSGSTLLCEALINTGVAGIPEEYFGRPNKKEINGRGVELAWQEFCPSWTIVDDSPDYTGYLATVLQEGTTPNGVFGAKVMWEYFEDFVKKLQSILKYEKRKTQELLQAIYPNLRYVWITRQDKARQAVSLWRAMQTWVWRTDEKAVLATKSNWTWKQAPPNLNIRLTYNFEAIDVLKRHILAQERAWQQFFHANHIEPLMVTYEELVEAYEIMACRILRYLDIPFSQERFRGERRLEKQADELSEQWVRLYYMQSEAGGATSPSSSQAPIRQVLRGFIQ